LSAIDPAGAQAKGPVHDLLRLQTDFQERLATETLRYLRQLQGLVGPTVPGTLLLPDSGLELSGAGTSGSSLTIPVSLENRQRVHVLVSPSLSPLVSDSGVTWFADAEIDPASVLLASSETRVVSITLGIPADAPAGTYRGTLLLYGFERGALPVRVVIEEATRAAPSEAAAAAPPGRNKAKTKPAAGRVRKAKPNGGG
jgi:hypothetical protein